MDEPGHSGGCACGAVRIEASGEPYRVGLCHCLTCRKRHAAPFSAFAVFPRERVRFGGGEIAAFRSSGTGQRHFCRACGSPLFYAEDGSDEIELYLGSFDEPSRWMPTYEAWDQRREAWLPDLPTVTHRYEENRTGTGRTET
ncbi:GFA family protein [Arenibaculum sp.]|jgi:hypothetical protein|uniref:GFA family protein n=1 Tax=Arenibaculum sp. TaxID=2865862 RepID=UPI002E0D7DDB|nr:GFA family protein [Arenibaculum sp.]